LSRPLSSPYHIHAVKIFVKLLEYQILKYFALHFVSKCLLEKRCAYKYFFIYTIPLNISFQRCLVGNNLNLWYKLIASVAHIRLNDVEDNFIWGLLQNGDFSVSSMYRALILDNRVMYNMKLCKLKKPLIIKIFMWYFKRGVVLTKDNLVRRNWKESKLCVFFS
jgi:hypothetical protein